MRKNKTLSFCLAIAGLFAFAPTALAQDAVTFGLDAAATKNNVEVEQALDGSWLIQTTGADPFVATTPLSRNLADDENTLTFEFKADKVDGLEFFFSTNAGTTYAGGKSYALGDMPATSEWTKVSVDLTQARSDWEWGKKGMTMRLDAGTVSGLRFEIRNITITNEPCPVQGFEMKDGALQVNTQADFDNWLASRTAFPDAYRMGNMSITLNTDVKLTSTQENVIIDYYGTFDGNCHTMTMDIKGPENPTAVGNGTGFIRNLYGTVKNLKIDGVIEGWSQFMSSLTKDVLGSARVENIYSTVTLISHRVGDGTHGGIIGRVMGGSSIRNLVFAGKYENPEGGTIRCGGVIGWTNVVTNFENILMMGDMSQIADTDGLCNLISRDSGNKGVNIQGKNLFAVVDGEITTAFPPSATIITSEQLASGMVCFAFNSTQEDVKWFQTLGEDLGPVLDNTHKQVFAVGNINCDGSIIGEAEYNNTSGDAVPEHSYVDGVCENCGANQPGFVELVDGWYVITTGEQLSYIANFASSHPDINIKLDADIDMEGLEYNPIVNGYIGTFDGQHHTISNLYINRPETVAQALVGFAGPCTIKNITLDASCYIEGAGYSAGFVGESNAAGTITLEGLVMHGTVVAHGPNAAGIYACNMGSVANIVMNNCGVTGSITGERESGLLTGWFGQLANVTNCWSIGVVVGCDENEASQFSRPATGNDKFTNCYTTQGKRANYTTINPDAAETGELTWLLNGQSFKNPTWYQNLSEGDVCPSLDPSRGIIYPTPDGYATYDPSDPDSYEAFVEGFKNIAREYMESEDVQEYCAVALAAEYATCVEAYEETTDMESFIAVYDAEQAKKAEVKASVAAYKNYAAVIADLVATLAERDDFSGADRDLLEKVYIEGVVEAGEDDRLPNGSYITIMDARVLTPAQLTEECKLVDELLRKAVANGFATGTDITNVLVNANFADGWNGWTGKFTSTYASVREGSTMHSVEGIGNDPWHMYQEITVGKSGIYELKVAGAWRPFNQWLYNSIEYYPYIYINGNANYLQSDIEDYIPREEAIDGVNCNLTPNLLPDLVFVGEEGDTLGYVMQGLQGICDAIQAGRYDNRILVYANAGDVLRIGVNHPQSEYANPCREWVGFGDIHLIYQGELSEAGEAIDRVVASMTARAKNLLAIEPSTDENYVRFPNWNNGLKERVSAAMEKMQSGDLQAKYDAIEEMSAAFLEIIECKKAYRRFFAAIDAAYDTAASASSLDPEGCAALMAQAEEMMKEGLDAYIAGDMTTEEANECAIAKNLPLYPSVDENGVYHIANTAEYIDFVKTANANTTDSNGKIYNAVLEGDVFVDESIIINDFYGTFDGQFHTMKLNISRTAENAAPFQMLRKGATVKNLVVRGSISTSAKFAASVAAHGYDGSTIDRIESYVDIFSDVEGDGTHGGILAVGNSGTNIVSNCVFAGSMSGSDTNSNGGLIGWSAAANAQNSLVIANISTMAGSNNIIGRGTTTASNCYFLTPYEAAPDGATQITDAELANGSVAYRLNNGNNRPDAAWRQNLGADLVPTLDPTHKIVYRTADGKYTNEPQNEIELHMGTQEDPFIINTASDMALLRGMMTPGRINYIKLGADIDMAGMDNWETLNQDGDKDGDWNYRNIVDFDGQGHVIKNFTATDPDKSYNSFFGILCGHVRNVGFENVNVASAKGGTGVIAGYMGHDHFCFDNNTKQASSLTNVWVSGKLNVESGYCGGMIGNVAGPSTFKNCYTNLEITSGADYTGGIIGRVREEVAMDGAYAAGSISGTSVNVGGIIGGAQQALTTPSYYNNIAVWNNTDSNFGPTIAATNEKLPEADLLDVVFNADGTAEDVSPMANPIEVIGEMNTTTNEQYGTTAYLSKGNASYAGVNFLKVDYSNNEVLKEAFTNGYTMETTFIVREDAITDMIKPFCATQSGGFGIQIASDLRLQGTVQTTLDGKDAYRTATADVNIKLGQLYHVVAVYDPAGQRSAIYMNGGSKGEVAAPGVLHFPAKVEAQWVGIGADPSNNYNVGQAAAQFEVLNARIYSTPASDAVAKALYMKQMKNVNYFEGDRMSNISFYNGNNFAELQSTVVGWGKPWTCDMKEGSYPVFDGSQTAIGSVKTATSGKIYNINGIEVEKAENGIFIIDGKKVMK